MSRCLEALFVAGSELLTDKVIQEMCEYIKKELPANITSPTGYQVYHGTGSTIYTMKGGKLSTVQAMAVLDGVIKATGTTDEVLNSLPKSSTPQMHDIKTGSIVPGFVEPHLHVLLSSLLLGYFVNCDPLVCNDFSGVISALTKGADTLKDTEWLLGYGYDPSRMELVDGKFEDLTADKFTSAKLDKHPALIINASGHLAYANKLAFQEVGVEDMNNGILIEPDAYTKFLLKAFLKNFRRIPLIKQGLSDVVKQWSSRGFTTVFDAGINVGEHLILDLLATFGPVRIAGAAAHLNPDDAAKVVGGSDMPDGGKTFGALTIKTIKLWMDGSTQGFTAALNDEYLSNTFPSYLNSRYGWARWRVPTTNITPLINSPIYDEMLKWAHRGYQLMVHSNGDLASDVVLTAYEKLFQAFPEYQKRMNRIEHFTVTRKDQVEKAARLQLGVSHTIGHVEFWGDTFRNNILGENRAVYIDPVKQDTGVNCNGSVDKNGPVCYSFNSDSPVSQADALTYIRTAMTRLEYGKPDVVLGDQTVDFEAALAGVTYNPARQILMSDAIGSLEVGKSADFVVFGDDIGSVAAANPGDIDKLGVKQTWLKGIMRFPTTDS